MNQKKSDKPWFIYLIKNKLNQLYCGITVDPARRFFEHASNHPKCAKALKGKGPLNLLFCAEVGTQSDALKLELWLKKQSRQSKDKLILGATKLPFEHLLIETKQIQSETMLKIKAKL
ncbi:GIY-YIG nuclease family protein [Glaciecola sp. MF2-115]|uniref:GIY-YIG nuclease family protein n=1 Tax=Glaciecola sp. MF2-115 TaxID=3384827 RepID=UPI00399F7210